MIDKLAWVYLKEGRLLCVRSHNKSLFYLPGGKRDPGESDQEALCREVDEELSVTLVPKTLVAAGLFEAQADGKPEGTLVRLTCYGGDYSGTLAPASEIAELAWLGWDDLPRCSVAARLVMASLKEQGLLAD